MIFWAAGENDRQVVMRIYQLDNPKMALVMTTLGVHCYMWF